LSEILPDEDGAPPGEELPHSRDRVHDAVSFVLKYVVGLSLIAWMAWSGKLDFSVAASLPAALVVECAALAVLQTLLGALRVRYILAHQGISSGVWQCVLFNCAGILYSAFLPGGISGDAVRAYLFMKAAPGNRGGILGAMFLDRVLGLLSMVTLGLAAALYMSLRLPLMRPYLLAFAALLALLAGGVGLLRYLGARHADHETPFARLGLWRKLERLAAELSIHRYPIAVLGWAVVQSMVIHLMAFAVIYLCSVQSGAGLGFMEVFVATPVGLLVNAIPLSPGGLGIGENAFELLYRAIGGAHGATSFLLARFFLYSPAIVGLVYVVQRLAFRKRK